MAPRERLPEARPAWLPGTSLEEDAVVPDVAFHDAGGRPVSLWSFRQRNPVVLAFLHEGCEPCGRFARDLAALEPEIRWAGGVVRAVLARASALALPVLVDPDGSARRRLLGPDADLPTVLVIDRYGAPWASYPVPGHRFPSAEEIVASVRHEAFQCPECGVPTWG